MVLELRAPVNSSSINQLLPILPKFLSYILSFLYVGIYWNNHHHLLHTVKNVSTSIMWCNLNLLFWLSLVPFVTNWMGENNFSQSPTALYGVVLLACAVSYWLLQYFIMKSHGDKESLLASAIGKDYKGKLSLLCYLVAIPLCFVNVAIGAFIYFAIPVFWMIPDRRIERAIKAEVKVRQ